LKSSLKFRAAIAITLLFLALVVVIALLQARFVRSAIVAEVAGRQAAQVERAADNLDQRLEVNLRALEGEAAVLPPEILAHPEQLPLYLAKEASLLVLFDAVLVMSPTGEVLADSPEVERRRGLQVGDREFFKRSMATLKPVISAPYLGRATQRPEVIMMAPVRDANGRLLGFLAGTLDLLRPNFLGRLANATVGKAGHYFVITKDAASTYVMHPDRSLLMRPSTGPAGMRSNETALAGDEATRESADRNGVESLVSYKSLVTVPWLLGARYPLEEALAPVVNADRQLWVVSGAMAVVLAPIVWLLAWTLMAPLLRLRNDVRRLTGTTGTISLGLLARQDEIGDLARDFDALIAQRKQGMDALGKSEQLLDNIVENLPLAIQLKDVRDEFRFVLWNRAAEVMFGAPKSQVIGSIVMPSWSTEDAARLREADLAAVASNGQDLTRRATVTHRGTITSHMRKVPLYDQGGTATHLLVIAEDISERVAAEVRLAESEARFRGAADSSLDAFFVLHCVRDAAGAVQDFRFRYLNARAERMIGKPDSSAIGQLLCDEFTVQRTNGNFAKYVSVVETGLPLDEEFALTAPGVTGNWFHHQVVRLGDGIAITTRDISARKAAEEEQRNDRNFLQSLVDNLPMAIYVKDVRPETYGTMVVWNKRAEVIAGIPERLALGRKDEDLFGPDAYSEIEVHDRELLANPMVVDLPEHPFQRLDQSRVYVRTISVPLFGSDDSVNFILRISEDVTAVRRQRKELGAKTAELLATNDALRASEHRALTVADTIPAWVAYVDRQQVYRFTNVIFDRAFADTHPAIKGSTVREVLGEERYALVQPYIDRVLAGESVTFGREEVGASGSRFLEATYIPEIDDSTGAVVGFHAMVQDVSAQRNESQRLLNLAQIDNLTGLANRVGFEQRLAEAMADCTRTGNGLAVMYIDIDHFKSINDTLGHAAGDAILLAFAARLRGSLRESDTVARLGGDEFVVVAAGPRDMPIATKLAEKVLRAIRRPFGLGGGKTRTVTVSIGLACYEGRGTAAELVARADAMLYKAKAGGRNTFRLAVPLADERELPG